MKKMSMLQCVLTVCFVTAHIASNILTVKPAMLPFSLATTCGAFVFPVTYIISDVFSEVYGYRFSRLSCYMSFAASLAVSLLIVAAIAAPAPQWWDMQESFEAIMGSSPRVLVASLLAFVLGDSANDRVFAAMKRNSRIGFAARAIVSSLVGQIVDSCVFIPVTFIGAMPMSEIGKMIVLEVTVKTSFEAAVVPLTAAIAAKVSEYEAR